MRSYADEDASSRNGAPTTMDETNGQEKILGRKNDGAEKGGGETEDSAGH